MKIKNILYAVFPGIGNCASNKELRKQLFPDEGQKDIKFDTVLSASTHPDIITDDYYNDIIFIHTISYNGVHAASVAQQRAQSYSAGGGGFSSSGGGGGSFGGGGGGGGFR